MQPDRSDVGGRLERPLRNVHVLDLGGVGPIGRCSGLLRDLGADVTKVLRIAPEAGQAAPFFLYGAQRDLHCLRLDLRLAGARDAVRHLSRSMDVVLESFRPGVAAGLGLDHETLRRAHPRLVYCSLTGYGQTGPYASWAGHDLNYVAVSGALMAGRRDEGGRPCVPGLAIADGAAGGWQGVVAVLAALHQREQTGQGAFVDVAASDGMIDLMSVAIDEYLATGRASNGGDGLTTGRMACYDVYRCRDGRWIAVGAIEPKFFRNLCRLLGCEQLATAQYDENQQDELRTALATRFAERDRDAWVAELAENDTCVAPVLDIGEATTDAHHRARGRFVRAEHEVHGSFEQVGPALAASQPSGPYRIAAAVETAEILRRTGLAANDVARLLADGAAG